VNVRHELKDCLDLLGDRQHELPLLASERKRGRKSGGELAKNHECMLTAFTRELSVIAGLVAAAA
jgi:hypothetical protein